MSTSSRRIMDIQIESLLEQIKDLSGNKDSIYDKLNSYDKVIKKYKIDPLDQTALQIYEYLVEEQTIGSIPQKSRIKIDHLKFSRTNIQVQIQQNQSLYEVEDPQLQNHKLFSFAKNNQMHQKRFLKQNDLQPKKLFNQSKKSKSDIKSKNYVTVNGQESAIFNEDEKKKLNQKIKSGSVKTISQLSVSGSQSLLETKEIVFNSQKTKQIQKDEDLSARQVLKHYLVSKYLKDLFMCVRIQTQETRYLQIQRKIKYNHSMRLLRLVFVGLRDNYTSEIQKIERAIEFAQIRQQILLEQYFTQWRQICDIPIEMRQRIQLIQENSQKLLKFLFVNSLKHNYKKNKQSKQKRQQQIEQLSNKKINLSKLILIKRLTFNLNQQKLNTCLSNQIKKYINLKNKHDFIGSLKISLFSQKTKQNMKIEHCVKAIQSKRLLKNLRVQQNFMEVYWKKRDNQNKLIFLYHLLNASKQLFQRQGQHFTWMQSFQQNIETTNKKLHNVLSQHIKQKAFKRLFTYCKQQKQNKHKIKVMLMDRFLKYLTYSSYLECKIQNQRQKQQQLRNYLFLKNSSKFISLLQKKKEKQVQQKQSQLNLYLRQRKSQQFFRYIQSYQQTKNYYLNQITMFKQNNDSNLLQKVWYGLKKVLKQQIINKKLVEEYLNLKAKIIVEKCFQTLKSNVLEQKIFNKKQNNLYKLNKLRYFNSVYNKLVQNLKYKPKQKRKIIQNFQQHKPNTQIKQFFKCWSLKIKENKVKHSIQTNLAKNYNEHLVNKCFKVLKYVSSRSKKEKQICQQIEKSNNLNIKSKIFDKIVSQVLKRKAAKLFSQLLEQISVNWDQNRLIQCFQTIKNQFI